VPCTRLRCGVVFLLVLAGLWAASSGVALAASHDPTCTGSFAAPGVLAGAYTASVSVEGVCEVDDGPTTVAGSLTVLPGSTLIAAYGLNHKTGTGESNLTVDGNMYVESAGAAILGCVLGDFECLEGNPDLTSFVRIEGDLREHDPLGVVMHNDFVRGSITEKGGGGGENCAFPGEGVFTLIDYPNYSDYEESTVGGSIKVTGLRSCWLGIAHVSIGGSVTINNDQLTDLDAIEILENNIARNLSCKKNSHVWDSDDTEGEGLSGILWPRTPEPNIVGGRRRGECVLASPPVENGEPGPGPF